MTLFLWIGIALCLSQSATLSGLNLAFFTIGKLELQMEVAKGKKQANHALEAEGEAVNPRSIISLSFEKGKPSGTSSCVLGSCRSTPRTMWWIMTTANKGSINAWRFLYG
jgi:hypothetical protein